jgi:hypothetical protein
MRAVRSMALVNALLALVFATNLCFAEEAKKDSKIDPKEDINVFVTKSGTKFHVEDCRTIAGKDPSALKLSDAQKKCEACAICKPLSIVCITATGKKYHTPDCKSCGDSPIQVTLAYAKVKGYEACKICNPAGEKDKKDDAKK